MKKQNTWSIKRHLVRDTFYLLLLSAGTLLALFRPQGQANVSQRTFMFAERVAYQRAIEEVYWRHRIWPRADPKPPLDWVMSREQLEKKVQDYLRKSQSLEKYSQRSITAEQLQAEMDRMAKHTKKPEVLRELFVVLGNDPFVIAECLARPVLAERLVTLNRPSLVKGQIQAHVTMPTVGANYTLPIISGASGDCTDDTWTPNSLVNAPDARWRHTAVWTGSEMIVWGGEDNFERLNTGARYDPATDSWTATSAINAPAARRSHTAIWTGTEMIVWGGIDNPPNYFNTGGRYNPSNDSWTATSIINAPSGRESHTASWSGSEMIVWGGDDLNKVLNTGGRYNPSTDSWTVTSVINAPSARAAHTGVWTGSELIVWGGYDGANDVNSGGRYDPSADIWLATSTANAPTARESQTAAWTGSEMVVWGGYTIGVGGLNTGGRYDLGTDSWVTTSTTDVPSPRYYHSAIWTGNEMIVWGGYEFPPGNIDLNTGGRYNPSADNWTASNTADPPAARYDHTAVWSGSEMIVWGGYSKSGPLNTGARYCVAAPTPTPTPTACSVTSQLCGRIFFAPQPVVFIVDVTGPVDPATLDASDFTANGIPANAFTLSNGNTTITFRFDVSPVHVGGNVMHIPADAFNCGNGPVTEFTCGFHYFAQRYRPTPAPRG